MRHRVEEVDLSARRARVRSLGSDAISSEPFDQILFATGAQAIAPHIPTAEPAPPILPLRSMADADRLRRQLRPAGRVVIIGGGYIGLEMAEALRLQGQAVTLVEAASRLLPAFDPAIGEAVAKHLGGHGVATHLGVSVAEAVPGGVMLADGHFVEADLALAAIGVRPRVNLAAAAGDCAEARHVVSGKAVWYPLGDIANRQGRVAGVNIAGGEASFPGVLGTASFKAFNLETAVARP